MIGRQVVPRDRYSGYIRLMNDYFIKNPVYGENLFHVLTMSISFQPAFHQFDQSFCHCASRFQMCLQMFNNILQRLGEASDHFILTQCVGAAGILSNPEDDCCCVWMLAYGGPVDRLDEYIRMGGSTIIDYVKRFTRLIVELYGDEYLREPNQNDIARLLSVAEERGIPGMVGSMDCT
jgi:hypothetical protein